MSILNDNPGGMEEEDFFIDQPISLESDENEGAIQYDADFLAGIRGEDPLQEAGEGEEDIDFGDEGQEGKNTNNQNAADPNGEDLEFEDDIVKEQEEDTFKAEEAIEKLKNLGFTVSKNEDEDPFEMKTAEIRNIDTAISNIQNFMKQDDLTLCRQSIIQEVSDRYKAEGKAGLINSDEFKEEVELQMEEFKYSPKLANLQASKIRTDLRDYVKESESRKSEFKQEIETA